MKTLTLFAIILLLFQDLPYKATDEFEIKLDLKFKQRSIEHASAVYLDETKAEHDRRTSTALLPFLTLNVHMLKLPAGETRIKIGNNLNKKIVNRKISEGVVIPIEVGFTDDAKDRVTAHQYVITFLLPDKTEHSRVVIFIDEDGTFLVNGEKRGKF